MTATLALDPHEVAAEIDWPFAEWAHQCHAVSLAIVRSNILPARGYPVRRVARGWAAGVTGQHSWIVLHRDPYAPRATVVDPTLWSYRDDVTGIYIGSRRRYRHTPHGGTGTIWGYGRPEPPTGKVIELAPAAAAGLSPEAAHFLAACGPLDHRGWAFLTEAPVAGWPAAEIITAMADTRELAVIIPIDRLGMLTDRNPGGGYLPDAVASHH